MVYIEEVLRTSRARLEASHRRVLASAESQRDAYEAIELSAQRVRHSAQLLDRGDQEINGSVPNAPFFGFPIPAAE